MLGEHCDQCAVGDWKTKCSYLAKGFCPASVDGFCIGGHLRDGIEICHG